MPAATILSVFGLRAQVFFIFISFVFQTLTLLLFFQVILVAEYFITSYFLCSFHFRKFYNFTLCREGKAMTRVGGGCLGR